MTLVLGMSNFVGCLKIGQNWKYLMRFSYFKMRFMMPEQLYSKNIQEWFQARTADAQCSLFSLKPRIFGIGKTNWVDKFWGIWGIFGKTISTHFVTNFPLLQLSLYIHIPPNIYLFMWNWDFNLGHKELGIQPSCVRIPWFQVWDGSILWKENECYEYK